MMSMLPLVGKHALITGGAGGIGSAIAQSLLQQGAHVTLLGRTAESLQQAVQSLKSGGTIATVIADITQRDAVTHAFESAVKRSGPIDILINNAGQAASASFMTTDDALWDRLIAVNLTGTFHCTQAVLPEMLQRGWGRIINIASTAGLTGYRYVSAYCAAKHGVVGLTRALALEVAAKGITVNAVCPGYTETGMLEEALANITRKTQHSLEQARLELAACNPQKRLIRPEEVAHAITWLCLPGAESMNGQAIAVAGGEVM